ncbi:DNA topoisomerase (ATP-hydrolyzing) subunit B [Sneathia sanguinegens]|uniref:DNA topoisomerase (ATP-hydrolyzing) subunit B n=1 Tax=Sneathia sanguinegens TaxID=40543 RepID=UPI00258D4664|nr:DNA topoisomerase (ATP-hydrolyzing) subunit B [Sneathia sanguinegens]MDU4652913.1 DNA topoisomerase (ATP-hydrolyzing) subunit B [Sneathia sanguinegens]
MENRNYGSDDITVLEGLEAVRKRPGMYIGTTSSRGLHHLVWETVDNSIDEALAGYCDTIKVRMLPDNYIEVQDNGRGIPIDMHKTGRPTLEVVMTILHAGGKFNDKNYTYSGGLHGVGVSVVNALSTELIATVTRDGKIVRQTFSKGKPTSGCEQIGVAKKNEHGTVIRFRPDEEIFEEVIFEYNTLKERLKELAYLNTGLKIILTDERDEENKKEEVFHFEGGIKDFVAELVDADKMIIPTIYMKDTTKISGNKLVEVEIAMTYNKDSQAVVEYSFVNNINTYDGGTHVQGFRTALTRTINDVARQLNLLKEKKDENLQGTDVREGLVCVINIKFPEPQFESQTKSKLGSSEAQSSVSSVVNNKLKLYLEDHPKDAAAMIEKMLLSKKAREAAKNARNNILRKNPLEIGSLPGKLADCSSKKSEECEIYIVEGDSAGGSAKQGRDRKTQAILPLRGKILNVEKAVLHKMLENNEIKAMITAFGTNIGDNFDISKLRYGKIIIMTDADVDGAHIRTLMLTFFFRYLRELINAGHIFIAQPPLYKIQVGKKIKYAYSDDELKKTTVVLEEESKKYTIQRYKGLGEMNPEQLWETTMDPENRTLLKVTLENAGYADKMFSILMGDKVEPRRQFIEEHAMHVKNLDI